MLGFVDATYQSRRTGRMGVHVLNRGNARGQIFEDDGDCLAFEAVRRMTAAAQRNEVPALAEWPVDRPRDWLRVVNAPQSEPKMEALYRAVQRGRPFGSPLWEKQAATRLGLQSTLHPRGRPRKGGGAN